MKWLVSEMIIVLVYSKLRELAVPPFKKLFSFRKYEFPSHKLIIHRYSYIIIIKTISDVKYKIRLKLQIVVNNGAHNLKPNLDSHERKSNQPSSKLSKQNQKLRNPILNRENLVNNFN